MTEATSESEVDLRLAKAKDLIESDALPRALDELWVAEAHARGNEAALREMIEFTLALEQQAPPKLRVALETLVSTLRHDLAQAGQSPVMPAGAAETTDSGSIFGMAIFGGILGAVGAAVIIHTFFRGAADPEGVVGYVLVRMFLGFVLGAALVPLLALSFLSWRSRRRSTAP